MSKLSRRKLFSAAPAVLLQGLFQYPTPDPPAQLTDEEQDTAIRENAASNLFLWGLIKMLMYRVRELEGKFLNPYGVSEWETWEKDT